MMRAGATLRSINGMGKRKMRTKKIMLDIKMGMIAAIIINTMMDKVIRWLAPSSTGKSQGFASTSDAEADVLGLLTHYQRTVHHSAF